MAELRGLAEELGWRDVQSYIQSGNLVFGASAAAGKAEALLEEAIQRRFGLSIPIVIRSASQWTALAASNPFPEAAAKEPNRVMLLLSKQAPSRDSAEALQENARNGERITAAGGALWIHYPDGAGTSKLSPALIDRLAGSSTTARNYRTVTKLDEMLRA